MKENNTISIINAISRIATEKGNDGAVDKEGEPIKIGLKREVDNILLDPRSADGFGIKFSGDKLIIKYHSEILLKDVHDKNFEDDVEGKIEDICKFLKKEYKKLTGNAVTLTAVKEPFKVEVQGISRVRSWVTAAKRYTIGGVDSLPAEDRGEHEIDKSVKKWLEQGSKQKKPENVSIKPSDNETPKPYKKDKK